MRGNSPAHAEATDVVIVGAGISGCAAAQECETRGLDYRLLEQNAEPGGLTRSIDIGEALFDYTGHFLHLARWSKPSEIPHAGQRDSDWVRVRKKSAVHFGRRLVRAPFQYHLGDLPVRLGRRCLDDFRRRPVAAPSASFRDHLLSAFGRRMAEIFFFPYNEKIHARSLDRLTGDMGTRFFPGGDPRLVERGFARPDAPGPSQYNTFFWYPRKGGIGVLARGLARDLRHLRTACRVERLDLDRRILWTTEGQIAFRRLISSAPLQWLCELSTDDRLRRWWRKLGCSRVLCLNLLVRGALPSMFSGCQWVYVPGRDIPFYRFGVYSHLPARFGPPGTTALYVEAAFPGEAARPGASVVVDDILASVEKLRWVRRSDVLAAAAQWIDPAYVRFDEGRPAAVKDIFGLLAERGVSCVGRYGRWDYLSMEDSIASGLEAVRRLPPC